MQSHDEGPVALMPWKDQCASICLVSSSQRLPSHGGPLKLQPGRPGAELVMGILRSPADCPGLALPKEKMKSLVTCRQLIEGVQLYVQCLCANCKKLPLLGLWIGNVFIPHGWSVPEPGERSRAVFQPFPSPPLVWTSLWGTDTV